MLATSLVHAAGAAHERLHPGQAGQPAVGAWQQPSRHHSLHMNYSIQHCWSGLHARMAGACRACFATQCWQACNRIATKKLKGGSAGVLVATSGTQELVWLHSKI